MGCPSSGRAPLGRGLDGRWDRHAWNSDAQSDVDANRDAEALVRVIEQQGVGGLVIGLPVNMDGSEGPRCQSTRQFAANLLTKIEIPIAFWDERLSTAAVERFLTEEADMTRKRRAEVVDKMAAAYILQGALDRLGHRSSLPRLVEGAGEG